MTTNTSAMKHLPVVGMMAMAAGMPDLGQQREIATKPGSGVVRKRDRPQGFWGNKPKRTPRVLTDAQRAKHTAKSTA